MKTLLIILSVLVSFNTFSQCGTTVNAAERAFHCQETISNFFTCSGGMAINGSLTIPSTTIYSSIIDTALIGTRGYIRTNYFTRTQSDARYLLSSVAATIYQPLGTYATPSNTITFTNKSGNISQWTNDSGYLTSVAAQSFASLTGKPTTLSGYGITDGITSSTAVSTYQTLSNLSTELTASASKYPSVNAVNTGLATKEPTLANIINGGTGGIAIFNAKGLCTGYKKQEIYTSTTNSSGNVTFTYAGSYGATPNVQYNLGNGANNKETIIVTAKSATSVTVLVQVRTDVIGLLPSYAAVNGREVDFIITEK